MALVVLLPLFISYRLVIVLVCVLDMGFGRVANLVLRMVQGSVQVGWVQ